MLMPKRVKYRKPFRRPLRGRTKGGATVAFGDYGLQALENIWLTARQIEAARIAITRKMKKGGKLWIRVFPDVAYTKKPLETRMGKGKGNPEFWVAPVKRGRVNFRSLIHTSEPTRLTQISHAVFCLQNKNKKRMETIKIRKQTHTTSEQTTTDI